MAGIARSRYTAGSLNSFVNILLDNPVTQFSFQWILSLNWLCQKWGKSRPEGTNSEFLGTPEIENFKS